jgi:FdrA protein
VNILQKEDVSHVVVKPNFYRDSLQLMKISEKLRHYSGVLEASIVMATETNKGVLIRLGFSPSLIEQASESDMIIAVRAKDQQSIDLISEQFDKLFESSEEDRLDSRDQEKTSDIDVALKKMPGTNLVLLSIPGEYIKDISYRLIEQGINQQIFSDHVPVEDELKIKTQAVTKGVLILGPGAGTSIINGKGIGFSNRISIGPVGIVAAAGTGLQEVACLLDQCGIGVKHGLGVGGNDPKDKIGGIMMLECMKILEKDEGIEVIAIISKPPSPSVEQKIMKYVTDYGTKKYVLAFIGGQLAVAEEKEKKKQQQENQTEKFHSQVSPSGNITSTHITASDRHLGIVKVNSLASCVIAIANALGNQHLQKAISQLYIQPERLVDLLQEEWNKLQTDQKFIRALYTGGTFTYEAQVILRDIIDPAHIHSNAPIEQITKLEDSFKSDKHSVIDLGEEEFTKGRPHPMIDPTIRKLRILEEAKDPRVSVLLLDFVLGYGSNSDPVGAVIDELQLAKETARRQGRYLPVITHVCGTKNDIQDYERSVSKLQNIGCVVMPTNALAVIASALVAQRGQIELGNIYSRYIELPQSWNDSRG